MSAASCNHDRSRCQEKHWRWKEGGAEQVKRSSLLLLRFSFVFRDVILLLCQTLVLLVGRLVADKDALAVARIVIPVHVTVLRRIVTDLVRW